MKKIYTIEALRFGFKSFFKKPLFFILAVIVSKLLWILGVGISFLISLPYIIHLIEFVFKIFSQIKDLVLQFSIGGVFGKIAQPIIKNFSSGLLSKINIVGGAIKEVSKVITAPVKEVVKGVVEVSPIGAVIKKAGLAAISQKIMGTLGEIKSILLEIMKNKFLFVFFFIGVVLFFVCVKMVYDFIMLGWARMSLDFYDNKSTSLGKLISSPGMWFRYVLATLIFLFISVAPTLIYFWFYLLITYFVKLPQFIYIIGYALAFVASWYLILRLWFYPYYIADEDVGAIESLRKSYNLGLGFLNVIASLFVFALILGIPVIFLVIFPNIVTVAIFGIFFTITWISSWFAYAYMYRKLKV